MAWLWQVDAARRSVSRQYILITPNAIEGRARLDKDVKIIRYVVSEYGLLSIQANRVVLSLTDPRQRTLT